MVGSTQTRTRVPTFVRVTLLDYYSVKPLEINELKFMRRAFRTIPKRERAMLALLIAAHNEELVLENTIRSAIRAGMEPEHIYVVDDNSNDTTSKIAKSIVGADNVIKVRRSGKGLALDKANRHFKLSQRYRWIHIADADGAFDKEYFKIFRKSLRVHNAAATGYVRSLPGSTISQYRVFEYTMGMEITRRLQATIGVIPITPGPTSCFRADVFEKVNFANQSFTEDFDVTLQIYRQQLGDIQYIPDAIAYTQDPRSLKDFVRQITRWNRGVMQVTNRHRVGTKIRKIDAYLSWQILQNFLFFINYCLWIPFLSIHFKRPDLLAVAFLVDVALTFALTVLSAARSRRGDILAAFPQIYGLRWVALGVFLRAYFEVVVLRRHKISAGSWSTAGRRYRIKTA